MRSNLRMKYDFFHAPKATEVSDAAAVKDEEDLHNNLTADMMV